MSAGIASFYLSLLPWVRLQDEAGQQLGAAEDRFPQLTIQGLDFHWYIDFPRGSLHSEMINYTPS